MKLEEYLLHNYLKLEFENFTHRSILALSILTVIYNNPLNMNEKKKVKVFKAINDIKEVIDKTDINIDLNLFVLDRNILPQDKTNVIDQLTTKFTNNNGEVITLNQDSIQKYLCFALLKIDQILMENLSSYSDEMTFE